MIFSHRDVDILKLLCWCQFIQPRDLRGIASDAERKNLMGLGLIRRHEKSGALLLTSKGQLLLDGDTAQIRTMAGENLSTEESVADLYRRFGI